VATHIVPPACGALSKRFSAQMTGSGLADVGTGLRK
jgi:hypothetical protein